MSLLIRQKSALFNALPEEISAIQLWIGAVPEKIRAESVLLRDFQVMNSALNQNLNVSESELISAECLWNSGDQLWFLVDSEWKNSVNFSIVSEMFRSTSISGHTILIFGAICWKRSGQQEVSCSILQPKITKTRNFGFFNTAQVTKFLSFEFSKRVSRLLG